MSFRLFKSFDKIKHDVLFKKLYDKGLSPLTVIIIMNTYLHGSAQVRWDRTTSPSFNVTNRLKQRSVISPLFFTLYVDELIDKLEHSGYGCKICADDIFLLSPSAYGLQKMLTMSFANQNGLHFNVKKTLCIMLHHKQCVDTNIELTLNGDILTWSCGICL